MSSMTPQEIVSELDRHIVGQKDAKRAVAIALRNRGLPPASPPPIFAATVISRINLVKSRPRLASAAPFLCLMVAHLE